MPMRTSSATASPGLPYSTPTPSSSRLREDTSSLTDFTGTNNPSSMTMGGGEGRVINALVGRIVNKLPCNSGSRLEIMEVDQGVKHSVQSLLGLVKKRQGLVLQSIGGALETLSKYGHGGVSDTPLETLHSQLYMLHILLHALSTSWRTHAESHPPPLGDLPRAFPDLPPIDESLARYIIAVVMLYARLISIESASLPGTSSPAPGKERSVGTTSTVSLGLGISPGSGSNPLGPKFIQSHSFPAGSNTIPPSQPIKRLAGDCHTPHGTIHQMTKIISRIIFILSTSNWSIIMNRIKTRISYLTTTIEDSPDLVELRLLEWSNLDRTRLSSILQEISNTFLHVKRPAQVSIACVFRKAIWNWIDMHPAELEHIVENNRKIEGGADVLFDVLHSASDISSSSHARRTRAFYPLMAMLLVICPEMLKKATMGDMGGRMLGLTKKLSFLESLRKGVSSSKGFETCTICYADLVRAAMSLSPRLETSGLRSLIPDIQNDLKNALFYSSSSSEISDPSVLVDGLVALYRADPSNVAATVFSKLFADHNEINRIVAVKACQVIHLEDARLPWYPPSSELRDKVAPAIRTVLKTHTSLLLGDITTSRRPRGSPELPSGQNDLVVEVLRLYTIDPHYAISGTSTAPDSLPALIQVISSLLLSPSPQQVRNAAAKCHTALLETMAGEDESALTGCGDAIWKILIDISRQGLYAIHSDSDDINQSFASFRDIAVSLAHFAEKHPDLLANSSQVEPATLLGMVAIVTVLVSPDFEQLAQSVPALKALKTLTLVSSKVFLPGVSPEGTNFGSPEKRVAIRCKFYDEISNLPPATGRQQQQRQFRKTYKPFALPSTGGIAMWLGCAHLAKHLTGLIIAADASPTLRGSSRRGLAPDIDGLDEGQSKIWQNLTLFLAGTASVCQYDTIPPPSLTDLVGKGILPRLYEDFPDPLAACESFIRECVDLLVSGSIHVRETVKEALGQELPGSLIRVMVAQMTKLLGHSVGSSGITTSDTFTTFVDQILIVLRLAVDRINPVEQHFQVDLGNLLYLLVQYLARIGRDEQALRMKIKFCQLVESVLSKADWITLSNEAGLRNLILDQLVDWSTEAQRDGDSHRQSPDISTRIYREVETATLRAIVPITENLVLRAPGEDAGSTVVAVKTRLFYRYYAHLVKTLERAQLSSEEESLHAVPISMPGKPSVQEDAPSLAITALSNLLSSNLDVGLKHCLTMGYHEDPTLRTAFMRLLTNILQQGARFGGLSTKRLSASPKVFLDALTRNGGNLALAVAICDVCPPGEVDEISTMLFRVFESKGMCLELVKMLVEREIALTNHESNLFRANSITTRILTIFARTYGYNYVRATLQPLVHSLVDKPAECSFELDPSKAGPNDDIERNADHLQLMCQALLDLICTSTARAPIMFRALCHHLWEVTADRFPESRHSVIGSFIFLRFFCPAIVAPENIDLDISPDTREVRRALLLITKVIQNLANNVTFGNKEPHMKVLNGFLSENIRQVSKFLSDLGTKPRGWDVAESVRRSQEEAEQASDPEGDEAVLHRFMTEYFSKLETALSTLPPTYRFGIGGVKADRVDLDGKGALTSLRAIVEAAGPINDGKGLAPSTRSQAYDDFIRHNVGRNTESVSPAFYEGPMSQNGRRIFYFIVSRVGLLEYDLLAFHVFSLLEQVTDFFDLVIDLTDFSAANELPMAWLKRSLQMCPPGILPCVNTLALYNSNGYAKSRLRRIIADLSSIAPSVGKQVVAASSPSELAEFIPFSSLALPEYTMALAFEADHVFTNLLCLADHDRQVPVVVKLGHDCIQIASWRKQDLTPTVKSYIIDVIRLRDIDDILTGGSLPNDHLLIKHGKNDSVTFISRKRNEMAQIIRAARSRLRDGPSEERTLRPSDVPGTLLNVALLNLSSGDEILRLGAYNLVYELSGYFKWDMALSVLKVTSGLNIPQNSLCFVYSLSSSLAKSAAHLTPEFLKEWTIGFSRGNDIAQKCAALHYITPWLANLEGFSRPTKEREDVRASQRVVAEIIRGFIGLTVTERRRLHLAIQEHIWTKLANSQESLVEIVTAELIHAAVDAGFGSEKGECAADILVSIGGTNVRGRVIARLRKLIASTYLKPSPTLMVNPAWPEISSLSRIVLALSFNPMSALDTQLFLPELLHIITLLLGSGPLLIRQTVYSLTVNIVQSLASTVPTGDMDTTALQRLLKRSQMRETIACFGLLQQGTSLEIAKADDEALLSNVEEVTKFLSEVLEAAAISMDCANAWRARWMSLVASTCFQHNPATQPQAFTVLGHLASEEVDDDTVYQILVAMSTTLAHFSENENILLISMLRCLCRIIPGLSPDSRYAGSLFWLSIGILQLGHIPPFASALELLLTSLRETIKVIPKGTSIIDTLLQARSPAAEPARRLDQISGLSFETDPGFSFVGVLYKGIRHPGTKKLTVEGMSALLSAILQNQGIDGGERNGAVDGDLKRGKVVEDGVGLFVALLPVLIQSNGHESAVNDLREVMRDSGIEPDTLTKDGLFKALTISDNSTILLLVTLVTTILQTASSESEKVVLYRLLAEASGEAPEVLSVMYDTLIPRLTNVLSTTSTIQSLESVSTILQNALNDTTYSFPTSLNGPPNDSVSSFGHSISGIGSIGGIGGVGGLGNASHAKSYSGSISSLSPSLAANGARDQALEDLGMKALLDLSFGGKGEKERVAVGAKWVAALIDHFTS